LFHEGPGASAPLVSRYSREEAESFRHSASDLHPAKRWILQQTIQLAETRLFVDPSNGICLALVEDVKAEQTDSMTTLMEYLVHYVYVPLEINRILLINAILIDPNEAGVGGFGELDGPIQNGVLRPRISGQASGWDPVPRNGFSVCDNVKFLPGVWHGHVVCGANILAPFGQSENWMIIVYVGVRELQESKVESLADVCKHATLRSMDVFEGKIDIPLHSASWRGATLGETMPER
jgi:hypothetical protein